MFYLIGVDDTDSATGMGAADTGEFAIQLGRLIEERRFGHLLAVTRHQLLQQAEVRFTSENRAACLFIEGDKEARRDLELTCREFLLRKSAPDSNPGFALAAWSNLSAAVEAWGRQAKRTRLSRLTAVDLARAEGLAAAGFHGHGGGVIGALSAVGLRASGNDGVFIWLPGLEQVKGVLTLPQLLRLCAIENVANFRGRVPLERDLIDLGDAPQVILRNQQSHLLLEACERADPCQWRACTPAEVADISPGI